MKVSRLLADNFHVLDDGRVRQFLIVGEDKALLIDAGFEDGDVYETARAITDLPVEVILTHGDMDHAGGLAPFGGCWLNRADWGLAGGDVRLEPLEEGDVFTCGDFRLETIAIPGHTYGSMAFADWDRKLLLPGDSVQKDGPIYMFGAHRNLDLYIESQKKLCGIMDRVETILPCHHDYPIGPEYIERNLQDALDLKAGRLDGTEHPVLPCRSYRGRWTEFYYQPE